MDVNGICQSQIIDEQGLYPMVGASEDERGEMTLYALAVTPAKIFDMAFGFARNPQIAEFFVSLDAFTQPDQGTDLDSVLCVFHMLRGMAARVGVMEYSWNEGQPITKPICWQNVFWQTSYADLLNKLTEAAAFSHRQTTSKPAIPPNGRKDGNL